MREVSGPFRVPNRTAASVSGLTIAWGGTVLLISPAARGLGDLQRDMSELNLTSQVLSRTGKVKVMPDRPARHAGACNVDLTPEERRAYQAIGKIALLQGAHRRERSLRTVLGRRWTRCRECARNQAWASASHLPLCYIHHFEECGPFRFVSGVRVVVDLSTLIHGPKPDVMPATDGLFRSPRDGVPTTPSFAQNKASVSVSVWIAVHRNER